MPTIPGGKDTVLSLFFLYLLAYVSLFLICLMKCYEYTCRYCPCFSVSIKDILKRIPGFIMKQQKKYAKEENTGLTEREKERAAAFQETSRELRKQGYKQYSLAVGTDAANRLALTLVLPVCGLCLALYVILNPDSGVGFRSLSDTFLFLGSLILLTVIHELVHGVTWSFFTENGLKDMEFGILRDTLTPYCTCLKPVKRSGYITGTLMPLILTGILPAGAGILTGNFLVMLTGAIMITMAAGDILIVFTLLKHRSESRDRLILDLPVQAGCMLFEK